MHPELAHFGRFTIYSYGVLAATGVLVSLWITRKQAARAGLDPDRIWNLGIYMVLAALVVAKLWMVALYASYYAAHPGEIFAISTLQSGGIFYGGVIGAIAVAVLYSHSAKLPFLPLMDVCSPGVALGHSIGRMGCFMAGCCWGKPTWLPWGVTFTNPEAARLVGTPLGVPLHPTQLYEALAEVGNFAVLFWLSRQGRPGGRVFGTYLALYGFERGLIEFVRGDPDRTLLFGGATSLMQLASVGLIVIGAWLMLRGSAPAKLVPASR